MQGPPGVPGPPGPPGPKGEVKNLLSFFAGGLTQPRVVETKGWSNLVLWELQLCPPLPFQAEQDHGSKIALSTRHLGRSQKAQESCCGLFLLLFPNKLLIQDSHYKGWVVASLTTCSSTVLHDQVYNMQ